MNSIRWGKFLAVLLSVMIIFVSIPMSTFAEEAGTSEQATEVTKTDETTEQNDNSGNEDKKADTDIGDAQTDPSDESTGAEGQDQNEQVAGDEVSGAEDINETDKNDNTTSGSASNSDRIESEASDAELSEDDDDASYPAQTLRITASDGAIITVKAPEGAFPEDSTAKAVPVDETAILELIDGITEAAAYDITIHDADGKEVQPKRPVKVTMANTGIEQVDAVYYVNDAMTNASFVADGSGGADATFTTDHFTIYVAGGSASDPNGNGSGANSTSNPYVLRFGQSVTLHSNISTIMYPFGSWTIESGSNYANISGSTVTNMNRGSTELTITVRHTYYRTLLNQHHEDFYIRVLPREYKVEFMLQDAGKSDFESIGTQNVYWDNDVTAPSEPDSKEDGGKTYKFYGWYDDPECQNEATLTGIRASKTVYAKYTTEEIIHYVKNTSDVATVPGDTKGGAGNKVHIGNGSRSGYALTSWNTESDGSGTSYAPGDDIVMPEGGLRLYAQWDSDTMVMNYHYNDYNTTDLFRRVDNIEKIRAPS